MSNRNKYLMNRTSDIAKLFRCLFPQFVVVFDSVARSNSPIHFSSPIVHKTNGSQFDSPYCEHTVKISTI